MEHDDPAAAGPDSPPMTDAQRRYLDDWLEDMEPALTRWRGDFLPEDFPFDFSAESLDALETVALERFPDDAAVLDARNAEFLDGAVRYLGQTALRGARARWAYEDLSAMNANIRERVLCVRADIPEWSVLAPLFEFGLLAGVRQAGALREAVRKLSDGVAFSDTHGRQVADLEDLRARMAEIRAELSDL
ncbi:MAG: hypothetical protein ACRDXX_04060, partial [Stackebrandtia sp.]